MEWHQTALSLLQQYLVGERHLSFLCQITESEVQGWVTFLRTTPSSKDTARSAATIATYARSARAFCHWLVRQRYVEHTPIVRGTMPKAGRKTIHLIKEDEFERLLLACHTGGDSNSSEERATARNRAILWVLLDTGMRVSELCGLRIADVNQEQRALRVKTAGGKERWLTLSPNGWFQLLSYLERYRPKEVKDEGVKEDHLFLSEWYRPLTDNALTLVFGRLKKRAGISEKPVSPSVLRDTFAVRYLQAGGELEALRDILGLTNVAVLKCYERLCTQKSEHEQQQEPTEERPTRTIAASRKNKRRRSRSSSATTRKQQRETGRSHSSAKKEPVTRAEDDP
jgi:integrase/recombinase XerD